MHPLANYAKILGIINAFVETSPSCVSDVFTNLHNFIRSVFTT